MWIFGQPKIKKESRLVKSIDFMRLAVVKTHTHTHIMCTPHRDVARIENDPCLSSEFLMIHHSCVCVCVMIFFISFIYSFKNFLILQWAIIATLYSNILSISSIYLHRKNEYWIYCGWFYFPHSTLCVCVCGCAMNSKHIVILSMYPGYCCIVPSVFRLLIFTKQNDWGKGFDLLCSFEAAIKIYNISHFMVEAMKRSVFLRSMFYHKMDWNRFGVCVWSFAWVSSDFLLLLLFVFKSCDKFSISSKSERLFSQLHPPPPPPPPQWFMMSEIVFNENKILVYDEILKWPEDIFGIYTHYDRANMYECVYSLRPMYISHWIPS